MIIIVTKLNKDSLFRSNAVLVVELVSGDYDTTLTAWK